MTDLPTPSLRLFPMLRLGFATVHAPRPALRALMELNLPLAVLWPALGLISVLSVLATAGASYLSPSEMQDEVLAGVFRNNPFAFAALELGMLSLGATAIFNIGRHFGGQGRFEDALLAVIWLQWVMICVQLLQIAALLIAPPLVGPIALASIAILIWCLVNFVAELHAFKSLGAVFAGTVMSALAILFAVSLLLSITGLVVTGGN